jgi:hypothetical protein
MQQEIQQETNTSSRKKFLLWGLGILSSVTAARFIGLPKKNRQTVKMLTQDGKLVEVDKKLLPSKKSKKISNKELQSWVKK